MKRSIAAVTAVVLAAAIPAVGKANHTAPTGLVVTGTTQSAVSLDWNDYTRFCPWQFRVYRYTSGGSLIDTRLTGTGASQYTWDGLVAGTTYRFAVQALECPPSTHESRVSGQVMATTQAGTSPPETVWRATHECVCWTEWSQYGFSQPEFFPDPEIKDPALDGVPRLEGTKALKLQVHDDDSAAGRIHAKVYKWWDVQTRGDTDVNGRYTSNLYVDPTWSERAGSWGVNLFQFKEEWNDGSFRQEAQWWLAGADNGSSITVYVFYGQSTGQGALHYSAIPTWQLPKGQWVKLEAQVNAGQSISFYQNGVLKGTAQHTTSTPVGPWMLTPQRWVFGTGNYGDNRGYVYVDDASFARSPWL